MADRKFNQIGKCKIRHHIQFCQDTGTTIKHFPSREKWNVTPLLLGGSNFSFFTDLYCALTFASLLKSGVVTNNKDEIEPKEKTVAKAETKSITGIEAKNKKLDNGNQTTMHNALKQTCLFRSVI